MNKFKEYIGSINEAKHKDGEIQTKDWDRMMDLVLTDKDGASVAKSIKDKNKALARYVAGVKLEFNGRTIDLSRSEFDSFYDKAIELGATELEIDDMIKNITIPAKILTKFSNLKTKKLSNRFVGVISKAIIKMGFDINFIGDGGNAITRDGKDAMNNGRKWTIGYKTEIITKTDKLSFIFDAVTDESVDVKPTYYVVDKLKNLTTGDNHNTNYGLSGQRDLISWLEKELAQYK